MSLPHIKNSKAGINRQEPIYGNLFEVYFSVPEEIQKKFGVEDVNVLTEQVKNISGLDSLIKSPGTVEQQYMGTTRSYLDSKLDTTAHDITITLELNMRNGVDNYIFKMFKAWNKLGYNQDTGEKHLKVDYVTDFIRCVAFNKIGDIYRDMTFHDVMLTGATGFDGYDYTDSGLKTIELKFRSDWADDEDA